MKLFTVLLIEKHLLTIYQALKIRFQFGLVIVLQPSVNKMSAPYASRFQAVFFGSHKKPKLSYAAAARYMGKSQQFLAKWVKRYKETRSVDDPT